jgi:hypothetical protein
MNMNSKKVFEITYTRGDECFTALVASEKMSDAVKHAEDTGVVVINCFVVANGVALSIA